MERKFMRKDFIITVQRRFCAMYNRDPSDAKRIKAWKAPFLETGSVTKRLLKQTPGNPFAELRRNCANQNQLCIGFFISDSGCMPTKFNC